MIGRQIFREVESRSDKGSGKGLTLNLVTGILSSYAGSYSYVSESEKTRQDDQFGQDKSDETKFAALFEKQKPLKFKAKELGLLKGETQVPIKDFTDVFHCVIKDEYNNRPFKLMKAHNIPNQYGRAVYQLMTLSTAWQAIKANIVREAYDSLRETDSTNNDYSALIEMMRDEVMKELDKLEIPSRDVQENRFLVKNDEERALDRAEALKKMKVQKRKKLKKRAALA